MNLPTATGWNFWSPSPDSPLRFPVHVNDEYQDGTVHGDEDVMLAMPCPRGCLAPLDGLMLRFIPKGRLGQVRTVASMGGVWLGKCAIKEPTIYRMGDPLPEAVRRVLVDGEPMDSISQQSEGKEKPK